MLSSLLVVDAEDIRKAASEMFTKEVSHCFGVLGGFCSQSWWCGSLGPVCRAVQVMSKGGFI